MAVGAIHLPRQKSPHLRHAFALNDRNFSLRTKFSRKNQTEESEIYRYIAKLLATSEFYAVPHLGVEVAIESQTRLGLLNKRVDKIASVADRDSLSFFSFVIERLTLLFIWHLLPRLKSTYGAICGNNVNCIATPSNLKHSCCLQDAVTEIPSRSQSR